MRAVRFVLLSWALVSTASLAAAASSSDEGRGKLDRRGLSFDVALEARYDDNILQLSPSDIDRLRSQTAPSSRFVITSADDTIAVGSFQGRWRGKPLRRRVTSIAADVDIHRYSKNDVKDYEEFSLSVSQELTASVRHLSRLRASISHIPRFYVRELTDDDASFELGTRVRESATFEQTEYELALGQTIVRDRLVVSAGVSRKRRNFNASFLERDNTNDSWTVGIHGRPIPGSRVQIGVAYVRGSLDARGDLASTPIPDDDISYDHDGIEADVSVPWRGRLPGRVAVHCERERRDFTTSNRFDILRFDRGERRSDCEVSLSQRVVAGLELLAEWRRKTSDASFPAGIASDEITDFTQNRWSLGLRYRFR